ncbi:hypothetical protein HAX54_053199 [Datura stramonium]|uniref:Pectinesterase n=1 Tax=Datura stramonium TaxID=4076 RepID=A0ABS8T007_DATST|nr:hypothetical protein [Datura stramonium]
MAGKNTIFVVETIVLTILLFIPRVFSDDLVPIPADKLQIKRWFRANVKPLKARKDTLDPVLVAAEANKTIIKVRGDESGDFKTLTEAINSIPEGNKRRAIIWIGGGNYTEKVKIERSKPFITLYGDPKNVPNIIFHGTAKEYNTVNSATVIVESEYFSAVNINFVNSAQRPDGKSNIAQAVALRTGGDKASLYNCKMYGFQDTFCDDKGKHFFKDCYIEGTVDFIFGNGKSLYLNTEMHVIPGDPMAMVTAHARAAENVDSGFSFVHCMVTEDVVRRDICCQFVSSLPFLLAGLQVDWLLYSDE